MSEGSGVELSATSFKVHANEQISTGDYENYSAHATVERACENSYGGGSA